MSTLTTENIAVIARRRINVPDSLRFQPLVSQALLSLARKVARRDDCSELRKEINVTSASGIITLSDTTLLIEMLDKTGVLVLNSVEAKWLGRYDDLRATLPKDVYYAALRNRKIYVKDVTTGLLGSASATGTLEANYAPTLSELPTNLEEDLLDEVVRIASGKTESTAVSIQGGKDEVPSVRIDTEN